MTARLTYLDDPQYSRCGQQRATEYGVLEDEDVESTMDVRSCAKSGQSVSLS